MTLWRSHFAANILFPGIACMPQPASKHKALSSCMERYLSKERCDKGSGGLFGKEVC
jgi:hypothetical protein